MATITKEVIIDTNVGHAWDALRDFGAVHERVAPGFVTSARLEADTRAVTFFNGLVANERLITIDDDARRLVYSAVGGALTHHNASAQVFDDGGRTRFVWTVDLLPDAMAPAIEQMMERGAGVVKQTLEASTVAAASSPRG